MQPRRPFVQGGRAPAYVPGDSQPARSGAFLPVRPPSQQDELRSDDNPAATLSLLAQSSQVAAAGGLRPLAPAPRLFFRCTECSIPRKHPDRQDVSNQDHCIYCYDGETGVWLANDIKWCIPNKHKAPRSAFLDNNSNEMPELCLVHSKQLGP